MKLKVGDKTYSKFFNSNIEIIEINSDTDWHFKLPSGNVEKAQTPLSYFEKRTRSDHVVKIEHKISWIDEPEIPKGAAKVVIEFQGDYEAVKGMLKVINEKLGQGEA
jgi:hypothetical protein